MSDADRDASLDEAFDRIEETILPGLSMMLDTLLDAAALGRGGANGGAYAAELRTLAVQLEELTRQVEAISPAHIDPRDYRAAGIA